LSSFSPLLSQLKKLWCRTYFFYLTSDWQAGTPPALSDIWPSKHL
jgi:hypothetical protein